MYLLYVALCEYSVEHLPFNCDNLLCSIDFFFFNYCNIVKIKFKITSSVYILLFLSSICRPYVIKYLYIQ